MTPFYAARSFWEMPYCTVYRDGEFWTCDMVADDHRYGLSGDGEWRHVEGVHLPEDRTVVFGMSRGSMADLYAEPVPCGHGNMVSEAAAAES